MATTITDSNFDSEVLQSDKLVFVDCFAEWCTPCKALKPMLAELAEKNGTKLKLGLLDIDENPQSVARLNVTSIPKVVAFKDGKEVSQFLGVRSKADYQDLIDAF
ncbi:MAG: thioredoxin family protein [Promethearchaeota archaeon]|jgi:thioredoxin 1